MNSNSNTINLLHRSKGMLMHTGVEIEGKVIHTSPDSDLEITNLDKFSEGKEVKIISKKIENVDELAKKLQKMFNSNKKYHLFSNNCECIAHELFYGKKASPQITGSVVGCILSFIFFGPTTLPRILLCAAAGAASGCWITNVFRKYDVVIPAEAISSKASKHLS